MRRNAVHISIIIVSTNHDNDNIRIYFLGSVFDEIESRPLSSRVISI